MNRETRRTPLPPRFAVPFLWLLFILAWTTQDWEVLPGFYLRGALWLGLVLVLAWTGTLKRFDYFLWFIITVGIAYGLAPWAVSLSERWFQGNEALSINYALLERDGNLTNDIIFLFVVVTMSVRLALVKVSKPTRLTELVPRRHHSRALVVGALLILVGMICQTLIYLEKVPLQFQQVVGLFGNLTLFGLALIGCSVIVLRRDKSPLGVVGTVTLLIGVLVYGVLGFIAGGGHKGAIFNTVLVLILLFMTQSHGSIRSAIVALCVTGGILFFALPAMNAYKESAAKLRGDFAQNFELLRSENFVASAESDLQLEGGLLDYWLEYGLQRVILISMPHTYVTLYWGDGIEPSSHFGVVLQSFLPRLVAPRKISSDLYYNSIAIASGIGNANDDITSRKPDLICESIILGSYSTVILVAVLYALVLVATQDLIARLRVFDELKLAVILTTLSSVGQYPYLGSLIPAVVYTVPFYLLLSQFVFQPLLTAGERDRSYSRKIYDPRASRPATEVR